MDSLHSINRCIKTMYDDINFGYILYKDFKDKGENKLKLGLEYIMWKKLLHLHALFIYLNLMEGMILQKIGQMLIMKRVKWN